MPASSFITGDRKRLDPVKYFSAKNAAPCCAGPREHSNVQLPLLMAAYFTASTWCRVALQLTSLALCQSIHAHGRATTQHWPIERIV